MVYLAGLFSLSDAAAGTGPPAAVWTDLSDRSVLQTCNTLVAPPVALLMASVALLLRCWLRCCRQHLSSLSDRSVLRRASSLKPKAAA